MQEQNYSESERMAHYLRALLSEQDQIRTVWDKLGKTVDSTVFLHPV